MTRVFSAGDKANCEKRVLVGTGLHVCGQDAEGELWDASKSIRGQRSSKSSVETWILLNL